MEDWSVGVMEYWSDRPSVKLLRWLKFILPLDGEGQR
jgi:hypothetical protein